MQIEKFEKRFIFWFYSLLAVALVVWGIYIGVC